MKFMQFLKLLLIGYYEDRPGVYVISCPQHGMVESRPHHTLIGCAPILRCPDCGYEEVLL